MLEAQCGFQQQNCTVCHLWLRLHHIQSTQDLWLVLFVAKMIAEPQCIGQEHLENQVNLNTISYYKH